MSMMMKTDLYEEDVQQASGEDTQTERIAFGAALGPAGGNFGPCNVERTVIYPIVFTNTGGAYNQQTGLFTAPVKGVYYFSFTGHNLSSMPMGLRLMKNDKQMVTIFNHVDEPARYITASNAMNLVLEKGDCVYVTLRANTSIFDNENNHSTFVGQLLFPL